MDRKELLNKIIQFHCILVKLEDLIEGLEDGLECLNTDFYIEQIKSGLLDSINTDEWDLNSKSDISYQDEPEKRKILFHGIKLGYSSALFWMADYFGLVEFFEDEIGHNFDKLKNE